VSEVNSISSRELAGWLFALVTVMESMESIGKLIGYESQVAPSATSEDIAKVARWMDNANFEIRDPWPLRVAVREVIASFSHRS
jgi:hypothetical protein